MKQLHNPSSASCSNLQLILNYAFVDRELVVVLAFSTSQPLGASRDSETQLNKVLEATNGELGQLLSHESFGSKLGAPVGGFFFHVSS